MSASRRSWLDELEDAAERVRRQLGVSTVSISRFEPRAGALYTRVNAGVLAGDEERRPTEELYLLCDCPAAAALVEQRRPYLSTPDCPGDPASVAIQAALAKTSQAAAPLLIDDAVWGEFWVASAAADLPLSRAELPLVHWAADRFARTLSELNGDLEDLEPAPGPGRPRHCYHIWIEGGVEPELTYAMSTVPARRFGPFTVFGADLELAELYELLDWIAGFALAIVGVGRDHAPVLLPPRSGSRPRRYRVRFAGRLDPALFAGFGVTVRHDRLETSLTGRLDRSALHGLVRYARALEIELIALVCES